MKSVCFYHAACADGFTAAWCVQRAVPDCELIPVKYGDGLPPEEKYSGRDVYIVDFSYPPDELAVMSAKANKVVMLDHHVSAIRKWSGQWDDYHPMPTDDALLSFAGVPKGFPESVNIWFDARHSGAKLAWSRMFPNTNTPLLVQYVQDRDLWKWEMPDSHAVNAYIRTQPMTLDAWYELDKQLDSPLLLSVVVQVGQVILRREQQIVDKAVREAATFTVAGFDVPVVNTTEMTSEIGHALCKDRPFAVMYFDDLKRGKRILSFRSEEGGQDVAKIAETFGGGGHPHAAGAQVGLDFKFS